MISQYWDHLDDSLVVIPLGDIARAILKSPATFGYLYKGEKMDRAREIRYRLW
jgi:hypothetical protein